MKSIKGLLPFVREAGELAAQRQGSVLRSFKSDGSVLTEVDREVDRFLRDSITGLYPDAVVISEENFGEDPGVAAESEDATGADFIFAVDPVDGTDCFSQGMPGWAISIGLLDRELHPIAGIVYAPKWGPEPTGGALLFADIGQKSLLNGEDLSPVGEDLSPVGEDLSPVGGERSGAVQVFAGSTIHKRYRMDSFPGKVRNAGSTVVHIVSPLLHRGVVGTIFNPNYIWDIAGAHAIILSHGLVMEYYDRRPVDYRRLVRRERAEGTIVAGTKKGVAMIRQYFRAL